MLDKSIVEGNSSAKAQELVMKVFAVFGLINYPLFFILEDVVLNTEFWFRIVAVFLCLGLFCVLKFKNQKIKVFYWFCTVTYCLPFFTTLFFSILF